MGDPQVVHSIQVDGSLERAKVKTGYNLLSFSTHFVPAQMISMVSAKPERKALTHVEVDSLPFRQIWRVEFPRDMRCEAVRRGRGIIDVHVNVHHDCDPQVNGSQSKG